MGRRGSGQRKVGDGRGRGRDRPGAVALVVHEHGDRVAPFLAVQVAAAHVIGDAVRFQRDGSVGRGAVAPVDAGLEAELPAYVRVRGEGGNHAVIRLSFGTIMVFCVYGV